ncbi:hypothetical protein DFH94DRAFT_685318 [Russula ochroleuca]|uniref:DUF6532 domain-containing protein n=1 Tax=Russula ochroleuca TaxID=152965 RepID=A0A9P5MQW8_9AGAM|nr:hypothetical protein DFH94DRAFT_685318 [Russula ochroleuca]
MTMPSSPRIRCERTAVPSSPHIQCVDAFPDEVKQTQWAKATWQAACDEVGEHYECLTHMIRLITGQGSWARGFMKDVVHKNFKAFKFKEGSSEEIKRYNQDLQQSLLQDNAFHHKNQEDVTGFSEHHIVMATIQDALFEDSKSFGVKFSRYFNPISINLLALVFTMIEFLINEWSTGEHKKATSRSRVHSETFEAHYLRTEQWCDLEPTVTMNIQKRMFRTLMKKAGALDQEDGRGGRGPTGMTESMKERAKEALAGRTGETDDEDE